MAFSCNGSEEKPAAPVLNDGTQLQQMKKDINAYPDSLLLVERLIQYYRGAGAYDSALAITEKAIKKAPELASLWDIKATLQLSAII